MCIETTLCSFCGDSGCTKQHNGFMNTQHQHTPCRATSLKNERENANNHLSLRRTFCTEEEEEEYYLRMYVAYMSNALRFLDLYPQILALQESAKYQTMDIRLKILESSATVNESLENFDLSSIVAGLNNRPPMSFREKPLKGPGTGFQMLELDLFEQAIACCYNIYPGYSRGLHSVIEYLAEEMSEEDLQGFSASCIEILKELGKKKDSTGKAARTIVNKMEPVKVNDREVSTMTCSLMPDIFNGWLTQCSDIVHTECSTCDYPMRKRSSSSVLMVKFDLDQGSCAQC